MDVSLQENEAEFGGGIFIKNVMVWMWNVTFFKNKAVYGGGLYSDSVTTLFIGGSSFKHNNAVLSGAGAHFEVKNDRLVFDDVKFINNTGLNSAASLIPKNSRGGAVYYSCANSSYSPSPPQITNLVVEGNSADFGGAMYFNNCVFDPTPGNKFTNNAASKSGPTFASYPPVQILPAEEIKNNANTSIRLFFENGTSISREDFIKDFFIYDWNDSSQWNRFSSNTNLSSMSLKIKYFSQSGGDPLQQALNFYAIDKFGQEIKGDSLQNYLGVEPSANNTSTIKNKCSVNSTNGAFFLGCGFSSHPGTEIALKAETNVPTLLINSSNISVSIAFRQCDIGEIIPYNSEICSMCPPNTYSVTQAIDSSTVCNSCRNLTGMMCREGGSALAVEPGYWRYNETSLNVIQCLNQDACAPKTPRITNCSSFYVNLNLKDTQETCKDYETKKYVGNDSYKECSLEAQIIIANYCSLMVNGTRTGYCNEAQGYKYDGVLCTECLEGFGKSKSYECIKCNPTFSFFMSMLLVGLFKIGLIAYTVSRARKDRRDQHHSSALRILITFFQIASLLFSIPMYWPLFFDAIRKYVISSFTTGVDPGGYSHDCILYWMNSSKRLNYYVYNALYSFFAPAIWTAAACLILFIRRFVLKLKISWQSAKNIVQLTFLVTYFYFWPDMLTNAFSMLNFLNIGPNEALEWRLLADPTIVLGSSDHWFILFFGIPTMVISGFCLPLLFFLKLRKNKNSIEDQQFINSYGFFYRAYKDEYYLWEFAILIRKMVLVGLFVFLAQHLVLMCITLSIMIVVSALLQQRYCPFKSTELNKLELVALCCLLAINYGSLYHLNLKGTLSTVFFVMLATISTTVFLIMWTKTIKDYLLDKITLVHYYLKKYLLVCWSSFKRCFTKSAPERRSSYAGIEVNQVQIKIFLSSIHC